MAYDTKVRKKKVVFSLEHFLWTFVLSFAVLIFRHLFFFRFALFFFLLFAFVHDKLFRKCSLFILTHVHSA